MFRVRVLWLWKAVMMMTMKGTMGHWTRTFGFVGSAHATAIAVVLYCDSWLALARTLGFKTDSCGECVHNKSPFP